jgi:hypothetical protein
MVPFCALNLVQSIHLLHPFPFASFLTSRDTKTVSASTERREMMDRTGKGKEEEIGRDEVAEALADLFSNVSLMVKGELEVANTLEFQSLVFI